MEDNEREAVIAAARSYLGTPYQHQGKAPGRGLDCVGIIECAYREAGMEMPEHHQYGREPMGGFLKSTVEKYFVISTNPLPADIMLICYFGYPHHLAIYNNYSMIHANSKTRKCVEHRIDDTWKRMTVGYYKWDKQ